MTSRRAAFRLVRRGPALVAAVTVAVLAVPAGAAPKANAVRTVTDGAFVIGVDDLASPRVTVVATVLRTTRYGTGQSGDTYAVCLGYRAGRVTESGCATAAGRPVTTGLGQPEGASIRARVPVHGRRGGWIEADLTLAAYGPPWLPPASYAYWPRPAGASAAVAPGIWRSAGVTGTVRTDRGLRVRPVPVPDTWLPTSLVRMETYAAGADAAVPADVVRAALR